MTSALVLGGTGFFGKRLVQRLLEEGCTVTVGTRGTHLDPFGDRVEHLHLDRTRRASLQQAVGGRRFDLVFDQLGYTPEAAADAVAIFAGQIGRYIFTSSVAVYATNGMWREDDFAPQRYTAAFGHATLDYSEGKRRAEAYLAQHAPFPVAIARFPVVIGPDDTTGRFPNLVQAVARRQPLVLGPACGAMNYLWADDAGCFLAWLGLTGREGAYNGASTRAVSLRELAQWIGELIHTPAHFATAGPGYRPEYCRWTNMVLDVTKAEQAGFHFTPMETWLPQVVQVLAPGRAA